MGRLPISPSAIATQLPCATPQARSPVGQRIEAPLNNRRGPDKVWYYEALRVRDGHALTLTAPARKTIGYLQLLRAIEQDNPADDVYLIADNLSSHKSPPIRAWIMEHPRLHRVFIRTKKC